MIFNKPAMLTQATLSDDERRDLIALALSARYGQDVSLRSIHSGTTPPTVEYAQYKRDAEGYRTWDYPMLCQCDFIIGEDLTVTIGAAKQVIAKTVFEPVTVATMSLTDSGTPFADGAMVVYPSARLLCVGDLRDKGFPHPLTTDDLKRLVDGFDPTKVSVNIEHESPALGTAEGTATLLSGKLGSVRKVWLSDNGQWVRGEVAIPKWLDDALCDAEPSARQLSVEVYPHSMELVGLALTKTPRVSGAALLSAFTQSKGNENMEITIPENEKTGLVDRIIAGLSSLIKPSPSDKDATTEKTETKPSDAQNAQVAALSAQVATLRATARRKDAETFVDGIIRSGRALPVEKDHMIALYIRAATDDDSTPIAPVRLSDGTVKNEPSRLELLKTGIESRPPFVAGLLNEKLPGDSIVLSTDAGKGDDDEEKAAVRQQNLMNRTPLGRKTMTRKVDK